MDIDRLSSSGTPTDPAEYAVVDHLARPRYVALNDEAAVGSGLGRGVNG